MKMNVIYMQLNIIQHYKNPIFSVQDEDKKSGAGDGQTTEDESSQDSKGESQSTQGTEGAQGTEGSDTPAVPDKTPGNADVDQPSKEEKPDTKGQMCSS